MKTVFGKLPSGEEVYIHRLASRLMSVGVITYGAAIQSLSVRDRNGKMTDVVLGFDTLEEYAADASCFGAVVGRFANRISGAAFELNGKRYALEANEAGNCLHSGKSGYHRRNWRIESASASMITLSLESPDGDGGFPGAAKVSVTYRIMGSVLYIRYRGASSSDTVMNLVNHSFSTFRGTGPAAFSISGSGSMRTASFRRTRRTSRCPAPRRSTVRRWTCAAKNASVTLPGAAFTRPKRRGASTTAIS
ncbi:MAG: hypothetical protein II409_00900 [Clostridia bacterium]|nr:hypothetical protein [Clostridia bacterium]